MYRLILLLVVVIVTAGCGGEKEQSNDQASAPPPMEEPTPGTGHSAIPKPTDADITFGVFGDEAANDTTLAVSPGEMFDVWAMATVVGDVRIAAAQYRVVVPAGVTVVARHKILERCMTMGEGTDNFNIAFQCQDPGIVPLMRYTLKTDPDFAGGEVVLLEGVPVDGPPFRGIVTCPEDGTPLKLPAEAAPLVLTVK